MTRAAEHPMSLAAVGRLAGSPGWSTLVAGDPLTDPLDLADADLLVAGGILEGVDGNGRFRIVDSDVLEMAGRPHELANGCVAMLRRALRHVERGTVGWVGDDPEIVLAQGRASGAMGDIMRARILPHTPSSAAALESGSSMFLDVGVGVAGISLRMCALYEGLCTTGLDVLPEVLALAGQEVAAAGMEDRVELRRGSVADLAEEGVYDLAWVPQPFIPRPVLEQGLHRVLAALKPDRWLVLPVNAAAATADPFLAAVMAHSAHLLGGGPLPADDAATLLAAAGFVDVEALRDGDQMVLIGRRP